MVGHMNTNDGNGRHKRNPDDIATHHASLTRRYFVQLGTAGLAALGAPKLWA